MPARIATVAALGLLALAAPALAVSPQVTLSPNGRDPHVAVDASAVGHFVWTEDAPGLNHTVTRYCHVLPAATDCEAGSSESFDPPTKNPADTTNNNVDFPGPRVLVSGSNVYVVTHRCCGLRDHPDGQERSETLFLFTSTDDGHTFDGGRIISSEDPHGDAVLGPGPNTVSVITHVNTIGMPYQAASLTGYTRGHAQFNGERNSYNGTVAFRDHPANTQPVAAWDDLQNVSYAVYNGGDYNTTTNWTETVLGPGAEPRLASGPLGLFLLHQTGSPGAVSYIARRWTGAGFDGGVPVSETGSPIFADFTQDEGGRLHAVWSTGGPRDIAYTRSGDGSRFPRAGRLTDDDGEHFNLEVDANGDGRGWVAWSGEPGRGRVAAVPLELAPSSAIIASSTAVLKGNTVRLRVGCPEEVGECNGSVRIRSASRVNLRAAPAARRILNLGRRRFRLLAGQTRTLRVRVPRRSRVAVRRLRRVRARATFRFSYAFGEPQTVVRSVRVRAR